MMLAQRRIPVPRLALSPNSPLLTSKALCLRLSVAVVCPAITETLDILASFGGAVSREANSSGRTINHTQTGKQEPADFVRK